MVKTSMILCAAALSLLPVFASAGEQRARLTVDVSVDGTERVVGNGSDSTAGEFHESYTLVTYLQAAGDPMEFNTKDPQYAQQMMARSAAVQQKVRQAHGNTTPKMTPQQMQAYLEKKKSACGTDQSCLMALAMEASQLAANVDYGVAPAALPDDDSEPDLRYQAFMGFDDCGATTHVRINNKTQGTLGDVAGAVPYSVQQVADYRADASEQRLICNLHNVVVDIRSNTWFSDGAIAPQVRGTRTEILRGKTTQSEGELSLHGEPFAWVSEQLRKAPLRGERSTTLKLAQNQSQAIHAGQYSGNASVKVSWRFEVVAP